MSADGHTVCPKCHPDLIGVPGVTGNFAEDYGYDRSVRENYEFYILDGDKLHIDYDASCWDCGWHFAHRGDVPLKDLQ